jgi:hypothetical protein
MIKLTNLIEELDPVGQEDKDVNNDGKVDRQDKYLLNRRKKIAQALKKEGHLGWPKTQDHEATMAKGELRTLVKNAANIYNTIQPNQQLPGWVSAYITLASDYMNSVNQYLEEEQNQFGLDE